MQGRKKQGWREKEERGTEVSSYSISLFGSSSSANLGVSEGLVARG